MMAGGIDWFRWHHGSVTDPKFQLVAKKAQVRLSDVIAIWAFILEQASMSADRGDIGRVDTEALELLFGLDEGRCWDILHALEERGLTAAGRICAWEKRQPKREREDDTAAERKSRQRARALDESGVTDGVTECHAASHQVTPDQTESHHVTPSHTTSRQVTPRGEESRGEAVNPRNTDVLRVDSDAADLSHGRPKSGSTDAQTSKPECPHQEIIALYHEILPANPAIRDWTPARAAHLRARWNEEAKRQNLDWWRRFLHYVADSAFLTGRATGSRGKPFTPGLDWMCKAENFAKIREGRFHEAEAA